MTMRQPVGVFFVRQLPYSPEDWTVCVSVMRQNGTAGIDESRPKPLSLSVSQVCVCWEYFPPGGCLSLRKVLLYLGQTGDGFLFFP